MYLSPGKRVSYCLTSPCSVATRIPRVLTFWAIVASLNSEASGRASSTITSFGIRLSIRPVGEAIGHLLRWLFLFSRLAGLIRAGTNVMSHFLSSRGPCAAKSAPLYIGAPYPRVIVKASLANPKRRSTANNSQSGKYTTTVRNMPYVENNNYRNLGFRWCLSSATRKPLDLHRKGV